MYKMVAFLGFAFFINLWANASVTKIEDPNKHRQHDAEFKK